MKPIIEFFARRPQSRLALVRLLLYVAFTLAAKVAFDMDTLYVLAAALLGVGDLAATGVANGQTTPVDDPRLGAGQEMPPALKAAALAVQTFLPGPIGDLFDKHGVDGMWDLVKTAEKALARAPTVDELNAQALGKL